MTNAFTGTVTGTLPVAIAGPQAAVITPALGLPVTANSAYSEGVVVGGLFSFSDFDVSENPPFALSGILSSVTVISASLQTSGLKLYIFGNNPAESTLNDHQAPHVTPETGIIIGMVDLGLPDNNLVGESIWNVNNVGIPLFNNYTSPLFGVLVSLGNMFFISTNDVQITLVVSST